MDAGTTLRQTAQRQALKSVLVESDRPLSAAEILMRARRFVAGLGMATIYRNLRRLVDERWLTVVDIPGAPRRYEVAGRCHHHHFYCESCDRVFEVPRRVRGIDAVAPSGFHLVRHEVVLYGRCRDCAERQRQ